MELSPDEIVFWRHGFLKLNATIITTWMVMAMMAVGARLITRRLSSGLNISRWQNLLEILVTGIHRQIAEIGLAEPRRHAAFLGTLFLFIAFANLCTIFPFYEPPTGSLSTTAALALCVFFAVPFYGIATGSPSARRRSIS